MSAVTMQKSSQLFCSLWLELLSKRSQANWQCVHVTSHNRPNICLSAIYAAYRTRSESCVLSKWCSSSGMPPVIWYISWYSELTLLSIVRILPRRHLTGWWHCIAHGASWRRSHLASLSAGTRRHHSTTRRHVLAASWLHRHSRHLSWSWWTHHLWSSSGRHLHATGLYRPHHPHLLLGRWRLWIPAVLIRHRRLLLVAWIQTNLIAGVHVVRLLLRHRHRWLRITLRRHSSLLMILLRWTTVLPRHILLLWVVRRHWTHNHTHF